MSPRANSVFSTSIIFISSPIISVLLSLFFNIVLHPFSIAEFINLCPSKDSPIIAKNTLFLFTFSLFYAIIRT